MYRSFEVRNFRCFRELSLTDLERVNLIAGKNNAGKTALLEALFIHGGARPDLTFSINAFRGIHEVKIELGPPSVVETPWDWLFKDFELSKTVKLVGDYRGIGRRTIQLSVVTDPDELAQIDDMLRQTNQSGHPPVSLESAQVLKLDIVEKRRTNSYHMIFDHKGWRIRPISPPSLYRVFFLPARREVPTLIVDAERLGQLERRGQENLVLKALQIIEKKLKRLTVVAKSLEKKKATAMIYGDVGIGPLLPLPIMGEGMVRLASLILAIGNARNGVVLVDEIENGFHYSVLPEIWQVIGEAAREFNTQIFATTHSRECIVAADKAFSESKRYDFRLHRLERIKETTRGVTYTRETLKAAIETGLEVR